jgi:hypothetical protein
MTFNGRKTAFWSHPAEQYLHFSDTPMTGDDLTNWYADKDPLEIHRPRMTP